MATVTEFDQAAFAATVATVLGLDMRGQHDDLIVCGRQWSSRQGAALDAALEIEPQPTPQRMREILRELGTPTEVRLTADGFGAGTHGWCTCATEPHPETWVRYERWTTQGREGHGYVCPTCRLLVQAG